MALKGPNDSTQPSLVLGAEHPPFQIAEPEYGCLVVGQDTECRIREPAQQFIGQIEAPGRFVGRIDIDNEHYVTVRGYM